MISTTNVGNSPSHFIKVFDPFTDFRKVSGEVSHIKEKSTLDTSSTGIIKYFLLSFFLLRIFKLR